MSRQKPLIAEMAALISSCLKFQSVMDRYSNLKRAMRRPGENQGTGFRGTKRHPITTGCSCHVVCFANRVTFRLSLSITREAVGGRRAISDIGFGGFPCLDPVGPEYACRMLIVLSVVRCLCRLSWLLSSPAEGCKRGFSSGVGSLKFCGPVVPDL